MTLKLFRHSGLLIISVIVTVLYCIPVLADDSFFDIRGFGKITALTHNSENYRFRRDFSQDEGVEPDSVNFSSLSNFGIQVDTRSDGPFDFTLQVVAAAELDYRLSDAIKLAAVVYEPNTTFQFRLGRIKQRRFLYSETKNIGFTQLWTKPIPEIYGPTPIDFLDGVEVNINTEFGSGFLRSNFGYGTFKVRGREDSGDENSLRLDDVVNANLEYDLGSWVFRLGYTAGVIVDVDNDLDLLIGGLRQVGALAQWQDGLRLADGLELEDTRTDFYTTGVIYQDGNWDISAEVSVFGGESKIIPSVFGTYLSVGYHFDRLTPFVVLALAEDRDEQFTLSTSPPPIPGVNELAGAALFAYNSNIDQKSISLGARFDLDERSALKFQFDHKMINENGGALWTVDDPATFSNQDENVQIYTISYEFLF